MYKITFGISCEVTYKNKAKALAHYTLLTKQGVRCTLGYTGDMALSSKPSHREIDWCEWVARMDHQRANPPKGADDHTHA